MLVVRNMESSGREIVGRYVMTDEDAVLFLDDETMELHWAPYDCVRVEHEQCGVQVEA